MRRLQRARKKGAFTLIELLVVIAIISLLVTILIPALGQVQELGRTTKCLANMRNIAMAHLRYSQDHKNRFMNYQNWAAVQVEEGYTTAPKQEDETQIATQGSLYRCPSGVADVKSGWTWHEEQAAHHPDNLKAVAHEHTATMEDGDDEDWYVHSWYAISGATWEKGWPAVKSQRYLITDARNLDKLIMNYDGRNIHNAWYTTDSDGNTVVRMSSVRHGKADKINMNFYDGHAETVSQQQIQNPYGTSTDQPKFRMGGGEF
ncbi:MAG: type II secretion system protein [Phycisphaerae bacterium]